MKKILVICLVLTNWAQAQWKTMQRFEEFGIGNFYLFTDREVDAKRLISETFNFNAMKLSLDFQKGANLLLNVAVVDPQNSEFVYVVHCIRGVRDEVPATTSFATTWKIATAIFMMWLKMKDVFRSFTIRVS
jgi:hypothetical protein